MQETDERQVSALACVPKSILAGEVTAWDFFVFIETFRAEVCQGFDHKAVLRVLREQGLLVADNGRSFDCRARLPGLGLMNWYRIKSSVLGGGIFGGT